MTASMFVDRSRVVLAVLLICFRAGEGFTQKSGAGLEIRPACVVGRPALLASSRENLEEHAAGDHAGLPFVPNTEMGRQTSRRHVLQTALATTLALTAPSSSQAATTANLVDNGEPTTVLPNLDCLLDLPPLETESHVRLYLCRHGQTENNRLGMIQGARINPTINDVGIQQATRLGQALARLPRPPTTLFHSSLIRARDTAQTAANVIADDNHNNNKSSTPTTTLVRELPALAEIDFGPVLEGQSADKYRAQMRSTYVKWAMGDIDQRLEDGAESGREVFARIDNALGGMVAQASKCPTGSCAAVTHSAYLRMLLSSVGSANLVQVANMEQKNCCVNVVDVKRDIIIDNNQQRMYQTVRVNEKRHLAGLV